MNLESYGKKTARLVMEGALDVPAKDRPRYMLEVLTKISPGLYDRVVRRFIATGDVEKALADELRATLVGASISAGAQPLGFFDAIQNAVSTAADKVVDGVKIATCAVTNTNVGKAAVVGTATGVSGGSAGAAAAIGTGVVGGLVCGGGGGGKPLPPAEPWVPRRRSTAQTLLRRMLVPGAAVGGGVLLLVLLLRKK